MSLQSVEPLSLDFSSRPIEVEVSPAPITSDAGLLPIRQADEAWGITEAFAAALHDARGCGSRHSLLSMVRQRVYGIIAGYEDQDDHDTLRSDPAFKVIADRLPEERDLASQPTLSRFENAVSVADLNRQRDVLLDEFIASFDEPPARLTLDIDPFDDPTHGAQQLTFFHAYYGQHQYQPRAVTCADNDLVLGVTLLFGTAHAALGADDDLEYIVRRLREVWPDVDIELRADSAFAVPSMFEICEGLRITYTFGMRMNAVLKRESDFLLEEAVRRHEETGESQRLFCAFEYQAGSWPHPRATIVKCEANAQGTNRRAVVTNRLGWNVLPTATYDEYAERGESENRNKELKCDLCADRLSDHRYMANLFRLYLHVTAANLIVRFRRAMADPPEPEPPTDTPTEALAGEDRRRYFQQRRRRDPLGEGHPATWRTLLIKVAAEVITRARRIVIRLSASWPHLDHFRRACEVARNLAPAPSG
jgi:hypothetical protein